MSVMGLDLGTTGVKACVFDATGRLIVKSYREYPLYFPQAGWSELNPVEVLNAANEVIASAALKATENGDGIEAIAISAQGEAVTPVAVDGTPLGASIVTFDARTAEFVPFWEQALGRHRFFEITGMPLHGMYSLPKIQWWKKYRPEIFARTWKFLCYEDLVAYSVFGLEPVIGTSLAGRMGCYDLNERGWSDAILKISDLAPALLARPLQAGETVGIVPPRNAAALNLKHGVKLVAGGHDQALCAIGCGIDRPGRASYVTGTVECMAPVFDGIRRDREMQEHNFCCYESALPGKYLSIVFNFTGGSLLKWCRDKLFPEIKATAQAAGIDPYTVLLKRLPDEPSKLLVLPHFTTTGTPHLDTNTSGAIVGLRLDTTREEIIKAVLEGVTYEMAYNAQLQKSSGIEIEEYRAIGGGAQSEIWMQIKADILGVTVARMENEEAGCLGGAMLALKALGYFASTSEAAQALTKVVRRYEPDMKRHAQYCERMQLYHNLYPRLKDTTHGIRTLK